MEDVRWLQRFGNLQKVFIELEDRIEYVGNIDEYEQRYLKKSKSLKKFRYPYKTCPSIY